MYHDGAPARFAFEPTVTERVDRKAGPTFVDAFLLRMRTTDAARDERRGQGVLGIATDGRLTDGGESPPDDDEPLVAAQISERPGTNGLRLKTAHSGGVFSSGGHGASFPIVWDK